MTRFAFGAKCGRPGSPPTAASGVVGGEPSSPSSDGQRGGAEADGGAAEELRGG